MHILEYQYDQFQVVMQFGNLNDVPMIQASTIATVNENNVKLFPTLVQISTLSVILNVDFCLLKLNKMGKLHKPSLTNVPLQSILRKFYSDSKYIRNLVAYHGLSLPPSQLIVCSVIIKTVNLQTGRKYQSNTSNTIVNERHMSDNEVPHILLLYKHTVT